jgi:predicted transcriptional regulator
LRAVGIFHTIEAMANRAVKKTISLPSELARDLEQQARAEQKTLSGIIQEALRKARRGRLRRQLRDLQRYWSQKAKERGILSERDLERYLHQ